MMLNTTQKENNPRSCYNPDCKELGIYPAPKSKENLREYLYFCINCIREFNKSWNYFEGLNEQELEIEIRKSTTWNRPSWKFGTKNLNYDFEKAFRQFNDQKKLDENKNVSKKIKDAFNLLDLDLNSTPDEIKRRYKNLAKKWHPDVQQNETNHNNNKFIDNTTAYKTILDSFTEK
jgi:curved DNA-binding protein CbpA